MAGPPGFGYGPPPYPRAAPPRRTGDIVTSVLALVAAGAVVTIGALGGFFLLAFTDSCPAPRCSAENAFVAVATALGGAVLVGLVGLVLTVVRLARRRAAWPFALATLLLCSVAVVLAGFGYFAAVGAFAAT